MTHDLAQPELGERLDWIARAHQRLRLAAESFDDDRLHDATPLPGWTHAHVLAHLAVLAAAFARQAEFARRDQLVDMYDGGRAERAAAIDRGALLPAPELRGALNAGLTALESSWARLSPDDWERPVTYRNADLTATQLCWWREIEIHSVDLAIGYRAENWRAELSAHLVDYLLGRLPADGAVQLTAEDTGRIWHHGSGAVVDIRGRQYGLAAWLAGRAFTAPPTVVGGTEPLPDLGPWP